LKEYYLTITRKNIIVLTLILIGFGIIYVQIIQLFTSSNNELFTNSTSDEIIIQNVNENGYWGYDNSGRFLQWHTTINHDIKLEESLPLRDGS